MSKIMPVGGKTPSNIWQSLLVNASGNLKTTKEFAISFTNVGTKTDIRDTSAHDLGSADVSAYNYTSLRVQNGLDAPCTLYFRDDRGTDIAANSNYMIRPDGSYVSISIPAVSLVIITPQDLPELPYMKYVRPIAMCQTAPEAGQILVQIVAKKNS